MRNRPFDRDKFKIAAFDFDGTLVYNFQPTPTETVVRALHDLKNAGVEVVASSGRDRSQIIPEMMACFTYAVLVNGACIVDNSTGKLVYSRPIDKKILKTVMRIVRRFGGFSFPMQDGVVMGTRGGERMFRSFRKKSRHGKGNGKNKDAKTYTTSRYRFISDITGSKAKPTYKLQCFFKDKEACLKVAETLKSVDGLEVLFMYGSSLEITAKGVTKATALAALSEMLGKDSSSIVAFGDSANDYEMLNAAGYAVVMENGEDCVKELADYIAPDVKVDGAATAIYELFGIDK